MKLNTFDKNEPEQTKNRPSEVKCPIQEFYYGGVVYDLETMPIDKIKDDIQRRINDYAGRDAVKVNVETNDAEKAIMITVYRTYGKARPSVSGDQPSEFISCMDTNLILGQGIPGSKIVHTNPPVGWGYYHEDATKDIFNLYNKNAKALGASRAKDFIFRTPAADHFVLLLKF